MLANKVYILDYDVISPIGVGRDSMMDGINANTSADKDCKRVNTKGIPFNRAAEVAEDLSELYKDESDELKNTIQYDRKLELLAACYGKMKDRVAELVPKFDIEKTGVLIGVGADVVPLTLFEDLIRNYARKDQNAIKELYTAFSKDNTRINTVNNPYDLYSVYLAEKFNAGAYQKSILTACVSSTQAIALASDSIRNGECEVVITGGTDSLVNLLALISFGKLGIIPESDGEKSCFPFDTKRKGTLAGEAAGIVIMASEDFVKRNELRPVAQFMGYGNTLDGYKITAPDPEGTAMVQAIKDAVNNAGITTDQIDYINAHGTGTRHNDQLELQCLERALGKEVNTIPISSTKDRHGHAIAAAGVQELCLLLELMKHNTIPKNLQLTSPCDTSFNLVNENYAAPIKYALTNNFAFGGINTVLTIKNELL
jgi:3-oxoacyl-[acyl-carrier-protein] synthase II